jgi:hypothetical protein
MSVTVRRVAVTLIVVVVAIAGWISAPAAAPAPGGVGCWLLTRNGIPLRVTCVDLTRPRVLPTCRVCPAIGFSSEVDALPVDRRILVIDRVAEGLVLLAGAELTADPSRARRAALAAFISAAGQFDGAPVLVGTTGLVDRDRFVPSAIGWLGAADADIVAGLVGAQDPDGDPVDQLLAPFEKAVTEIRTGRPAGD